MKRRDFIILSAVRLLAARAQQPAICATREFHGAEGCCV
jgi:hypothetical protein